MPYSWGRTGLKTLVPLDKDLELRARDVHSSQELHDRV
jgi:hypothetical protein